MLVCQKMAERLTTKYQSPCSSNKQMFFIIIIIYCLCSNCITWVHKKCSGITGDLTELPHYICSRCHNKAYPIDGKPSTQVTLDCSKMDTEPCFGYLGDMLCAGGGCKLAIITRCSVAWGKFKNSYLFSHPNIHCWELVANCSLHVYSLHCSIVVRL